MSRDGSDSNFSLKDMVEQQIAVVAQLGQSMGTMHHVDELFQWLAYAIAHHFNIQLVQFWTNQITQTGRLAAQLRTVVQRDPSIPEQVVVNDYMTYIAQRVMSERRSYHPQAVETLFPSYQAMLLKRYGLNYCGACFISRNVLLPPPESMFSSERAPAPLAITLLLAVRQFPHPDVISTVTTVLEQAIMMAGNRNLLQGNAAYTPPAFASQATPYPPPQATPYATPYPPPQATPYPPPQATPYPPLQATPPPVQVTSPPPVQAVQRETVFTLEQLIPRRRQDADLLLSDNPFSGAAIISDKKARRVHAAIDGRTNVTNLSAVIGMNMKEVYVALQLLLSQNRIELYEPDGKPANIPPLQN